MSGLGGAPSARQSGKRISRPHLISFLWTIFVTLLSSDSAFAHASDRGHVLLLPTVHYLVGGALAVAATFLIIAFLPLEPVERLFQRRREITTITVYGRTIVSILSFCAFGVLVLAGWWGTRDPLANPLPLFFWTLLWTGLVILQGFIGNLWGWINPWYGPWRVVMWLSGRSGRPPILPWPRWLGYWSAIAGFAAFGWFELVYPTPDSGEFLSAFLAMIARLAPFGAKETGLVLRCPGSGIMLRIHCCQAVQCSCCWLSASLPSMGFGIHSGGLP